MTRFKTATSSLHIALLLLAIAPAPLFAESSMTARQMLAQAQTQSEARQANGALKRITRSLSTTQAPVLASSEPPKPAVVAVAAPEAAPQVAPQTESEAPVVARGHEAFAPTSLETKPSERIVLPETKADTPAAVAPAPLAEPTAKVEAPLPLPVQTAKVEAPTAVVEQPANVVAPAAVVAKPAVATVAPAAPAPVPAAVAKPAVPTAPVVARANDAGKIEKAPTSAPAPARKVANVDKTKAPRAKVSSPQRYGTNPDAAAIRGQIQQIVNRPEVRAIMAQYGIQ